MKLGKTFIRKLSMQPARIVYAKTLATENNQSRQFFLKCKIITKRYNNKRFFCLTHIKKMFRNDTKKRWFEKTKPLYLECI